MMFAPAEIKAGTMPAMYEGDSGKFTFPSQTSGSPALAWTSTGTGAPPRGSPAHLDHPLHTVAAVGADDMGAGLHQCGGHLGRRDAHHGAVLPRHGSFEGEGADHFEPGVLARGAHGARRFVDRGKRLDTTGVGASLLERHDLLPESVVEFLLRRLAHDQHHARRADRRDNMPVRSRGFAGDRRRFPVQLGGPVGQTKVLQLETGGAKAVRLDHVGARLDISPCDVQDVRAMRDAPELRAFAGLEPFLVQEGPPSTVGYEDLPVTKLFSK